MPQTHRKSASTPPSAIANKKIQEAPEAIPPRQRKHSDEAAPPANAYGSSEDHVRLYLRQTSHRLLSREQEAEKACIVSAARRTRISNGSASF
jgi:hypothetical protein